MGETMTRDELLQKLGATASNSFRLAYESAGRRRNPFVELVHWIEIMVLTERSDVAVVCARSGVDMAALTEALTAEIAALPKSAGAVRDISDHLFEALERGWVHGTKARETAKVRTGHVLIGILRTPRLERLLYGMSSEFEKLRVDDIQTAFEGLTEGSVEAPRAAEDAAAEPAPRVEGEESALKAYATDLTAIAQEGRMDPVTGREAEVRQIVNILMRRRQNNPILTGEAGVGKTAVVEGFAMRVAAGDVPPPLRDIAIHSLDIGRLQAGASMKGQFEDRLRRVIEEVQASEQPIVLFIDEAHMLIGAGGQAGTGDAANLLKPALARGELRTIAATTWSEYKKHIEKDPALTRRFEVVKVEEPDAPKAIRMLRGVATKLEGHHKVMLMDEAIEAAVTLSSRYIPARQLPDKAVGLLDTASARVAVGQHAVPAEVEDTRREIEALEAEAAMLAREAAVGIDHAERTAEVDTLLAERRASLATLEERWTREGALVERLLELRAEMRALAMPVDAALEPAPEPALADGGAASAPEGPAPDRATLAAEMETVTGELAALQGERPMVLPAVDRHAVAAVVEDWTGIPVSRMQGDAIQTVLSLPAMLSGRVVGQDHAMEMIAKRVQTSRAGLTAPEKPVGVFLLAGPSGVGKTETALALGEALYGGEQNVVTINMSEFQEAHTVSTLKGAPPGYVGYGEGGVLTEAVRRRPYSVVLLDEIEKAHTDVHEVFFQVFDKGRMEDGEGREIDFRHTLILMTSNAGSDVVMSLCQDPELAPEPDKLAEALRPSLLNVFPPALLGRVTVIPYFPLADHVLDRIIGLKLGSIERRLARAHGIAMTHTPAVPALIRARCTEVESGGRMIDAILTNTLLPAVSRAVLGALAERRALARVTIDVRNGEFAYDIA